MIRRRRIAAHKTCMLAAFACSTVFLVSYVIYHLRVGVVYFLGQGWIRPFYFVLLTTHTVLAIAIVPLALITLSRALSGKFDRHRRIARWTLPIWLYVSVTGVIVYFCCIICTPRARDASMDLHTTSSQSYRSADSIRTRATVRRPPSRHEQALALRSLALTFLFVLMPFLFWQATWFGRPLDDDQLQSSWPTPSIPAKSSMPSRRLPTASCPPTPPRAIRRAPFIPSRCASPRPAATNCRLTAAWVMGQDNTVPEFHQQLLHRLLRSATPWSAATPRWPWCASATPPAAAEIRAIAPALRHAAPQAGVLSERLKPGDAINPGTLLGHIAAGGAKNEMRSQVPGTIHGWLVPDGATVAAGQPILLVDPSSAEVWEALRALYLIGSAGDLPLVAPFAQPLPGVPPNIRQQAEITAQAIRARQSQAHGGSTAPAGASAHSP